MKRRRFLQLTVSAAAGAVVRHSSALGFSEEQTFQPAAADVLSLTVGEPPLAALAPHTGFGARRRSAVEPDRMIEMLLEKRSNGVYQWTVDSQSHSEEALLLQQGRRYRLRMMNATGGVHTVHLSHHSFELARIHQVPVSGIFRDTAPSRTLQRD